jgi:hypothetical protein
MTWKTCSTRARTTIKIKIKMISKSRVLTDMKALLADPSSSGLPKSSNKKIKIEKSKTNKEHRKMTAAKMAVKMILGRRRLPS